MPKYREAPKNDMDSQRALLDSLMGINRNNDRDADQIHDFRDDRVCKFYLTGMCPHDIFVNTKMDEGPCDKIHSDDLKEQYEKSKSLYMYDSLIEREFNMRLQEADRVIKRARARLDEEKKLDEATNPELNPEILEQNAEISKILTAAEMAGKDGDIDKAQELVLGKLEDIQRERAAIMTRLVEHRKITMQKAGFDVTKKLRVCDVCGSFLSIFDSDKRLSDHFLGKQHIGFQYMRDTIDTIKKRREERRGRDGSEAGIDRDRSERSSGRNDRRRSSSRGRNDRIRSSRDRVRNDSRERTRERDRGGYRDRRDRSSSRGRNRRY